ncbi:MAG: SPOR domain-containing protein [Desulfovibrionales bacterium]|nr:SPOR domain-containing protein [Desulfovibrionales bacterium]
MSRTVLKILFGCSVTLAVLGLLLAGFITGWLIFAPEQLSVPPTPVSNSAIASLAESTAQKILTHLDSKTPQQAVKAAPKPTGHPAATTEKNATKMPGEDTLGAPSSPVQPPQQHTQPVQKQQAVPPAQSTSQPAPVAVAQSVPSAPAPPATTPAPVPKQTATHTTASTPTPHSAKPASPAAKKQKPSDALPNYSLLLGSYVNRTQAEQEASRLANIGEKAEIQVTNEFPVLYSVFTGKFAKESNARSKAEVLAKDNGLHLSIAPATAHRQISPSAGTPVWLAEFMSFLTVEAAKRQQKKLMKNGVASKLVKLYDNQEKIWFTIIAGQYPQKQTATNMCKKLSKKSHLPCVARPIAKAMVSPYATAKKQPTKTAAAGKKS